MNLGRPNVGGRGMDRTGGRAGRATAACRIVGKRGGARLRRGGGATSTTSSGAGVGAVVATTGGGSGGSGHRTIAPAASDAATARPAA